MYITVPGVFPGDKKRPVHKADNLTIITGHCHVLWETKLLGTLRVSPGLYWV